MAAQANLSTFNPAAFEGPRRIEIDIKAHIARKETIYKLALWTIANLAVLLAKITWDKLSGVELKPSMLPISSIIYGVFSLALGLGTLLFFIYGIYKKYQITDQLKDLTDKAKKKFYVQTIEFADDSETESAVLKDIAEKLQPLFEEAVHTKYGIIVTYELNIEGATLETTQFKYAKKSDNLKHIESTVGKWRKYYAELKAESYSLQIMQVVASQCIQDLLQDKEITDGSSCYTCSSPKSPDASGGSISHRLTGSPNRKSTFSSVEDFRKHLENQPTVKVSSPKFEVKEGHISPSVSPQIREKHASSEGSAPNTQGVKTSGRTDHSRCTIQ